MLDGSLSTVCFHLHTLLSWPPPQALVGGVNRRRSSRTRSRTRTAWLKPWAFAANYVPSSSSGEQKQSSVLFHTDDGNDSTVLESTAADSGSSLMGVASSRPVLSQPNTVGVIGGVSAISTLAFLEKLVWGWSSSVSPEGGEGSLPFIVCSDPAVGKELSWRRESGALPYHYHHHHHHASRNTRLGPVDRARAVDNLRAKRVFLERSGARCIVMPCNISHSWHTDISDGCSVPFLHVGECVATQLKAANLRPVEACHNVLIGVLATDAVFTAGFYQEKLQNLGFEVVLPDKATMEHTVIPAVEALNRKDMEGARTLLRIAIQVLLVKAVCTIVLASDDLRGILPHDDPLLKKCFDPMDALARSTIEWAQQSIKRTHA